MLDTIRAQLETRLSLMSSMETAWINVAFTPTVNVPYQRVSLLPIDPVNPALGQETIIDRGIFQVLLCYPVGVGPADAYARAEAVRAQFPAGLTLSGVRIESTPSIAQGFNDDERFVVPVSIRYVSIH